MTAMKQQALVLRQKLRKQRVKEETRAALVRQLAELLLQAIQNKEQGEQRWKR